ncbi:unnamed protein product [Chondrus crispus]|uniref:Uncharacterized protein n=1 Tax=Chondrus crispus TaxID=2769 RepID=R7Q4P3_CHOCR|nr:unnamed protein product [Chondrus crispus]CDF33482.1 unnamed protein product [Chondrus crispus]|eukprot:XP_005713285.1 unnamed protein product [Chondrus crispus]
MSQAFLHDDGAQVSIHSWVKRKLQPFHVDGIPHVLGERKGTMRFDFDGMEGANANMWVLKSHATGDAHDNHCWVILKGFDFHGDGQTDSF